MRTVLRVVFVVLAVLRVHAQIAVSANDTTEIMVDGVHVMVPNAPPDTVTIIDLSARPPRVITEGAFWVRCPNRRPNRTLRPLPGAICCC